MQNDRGAFDARKPSKGAWVPWRSLAWMKRLIPFFCFMLSGLALDAYATWYFNSVRACRGEPPSDATDLSSTLMLLIPALVSILAASEWNYIVFCLSTLIIYSWASYQFVEGPVEIQCYKSVGDGLVIIFLLTIIFDLVILFATPIFYSANRRRRGNSGSPG
jgi:hypothetical protein